jgi:hypothetical protein
MEHAPKLSLFSFNILFIRKIKSYSQSILLRRPFFGPVNKTCLALHVFLKLKNVV